MMGSIAEYQRSIIVENVKMGMKQRAREGKWNGGQVLGYDGVEIASSKQAEIVLKPNSMEAEVVRKIFQLYAEGQGLRSIANQMNREGHRTKPGNFFSSVAIKTIINNPVYVGKIRYNVREDWSEKRRKGINPNPMIEDGIHEPIISMKLWDVVQALFQKNSFSPPRTFDGTYPLVGLMRCPQCGAHARRTSRMRHSEGWEKGGETLLRLHRLPKRRPSGMQFQLRQGRRLLAVRVRSPGRGRPEAENCGGRCTEAEQRSDHERGSFTKGTGSN
ncbi:hypothetical protein J2Z70_000639 [Paenibacillus silagei]|uniref:Recombinase domain-containing protein n=2 Tax=Paenibacillus silagei TaxID=1670801 RepID=A0ABS4NM87_9BACL|nr:hypothetical protein [Paenibacillus silagei]